MTAEWYYAKGQKCVGPFTCADLKKLMLSGEIRPDDMVWQAGTIKWVPARSVNSLAPNELTPTNRSGISGFMKRLLGLVGQVAAETWQQTVRFARYGNALRSRRSLKRSFLASQQALGQRYYETGSEDGQTQSRLSVLEQEFWRAGADHRTRTRLEAERHELIRQLATQALTRPSPPRGTEAEFTSAKMAQTALQAHEVALGASRQRLFPRKASSRAKVGVGYGVVACALVLMLFVIWPSQSVRRERVGSGAKDDDRRATLDTTRDARIGLASKKPETSIKPSVESEQPGLKRPKPEEAAPEKPNLQHPIVEIPKPMEAVAEKPNPTNPPREKQKPMEPLVEQPKPANDNHAIPAIPARFFICVYPQTTAYAELDLPESWTNTNSKERLKIRKLQGNEYTMKLTDRGPEFAFHAVQIGEDYYVEMDTTPYDPTKPIRQVFQNQGQVRTPQPMRLVVSDNKIQFSWFWHSRGKEIVTRNPKMGNLVRLFGDKGPEYIVEGNAMAFVKEIMSNPIHAGYWVPGRLFECDQDLPITEGGLLSKKHRTSDYWFRLQNIVGHTMRLVNEAKEENKVDQIASRLFVLLKKDLEALPTRGVDRDAVAYGQNLVRLYDIAIERYGDQSEKAVGKFVEAFVRGFCGDPFGTLLETIKEERELAREIAKRRDHNKQLRLQLIDRYRVQFEQVAE